MAENQQEIQQLAMIYRELEAQIQSVNEQIAFIENSQSGISITKKTIEEIRTKTPDQEIILPIGNSAFIKAKVVDPDNFLISIGKDVLVEKNAEDALVYSRKMEEEYAKAKTVLDNRMKEISAQMEQIRPKLQQYVDVMQNSQAAQRPQ